MTAKEYFKQWCISKGIENVNTYTEFNYFEMIEVMESYKDDCINAISVNLENNDEKEAYLIGFEHGKKLIENRVNAISDERKRVANELQGELIQANEDLANGKLIEVKWIKHTSFIKGKISALLNY